MSDERTMLIRLTGRLETAVGLLREQEWAMYDGSVGDYACRWCLALRSYDKGVHKPDCRLAAFLASAPPVPPPPTCADPACIFKDPHADHAGSPVPREWERGAPPVHAVAPPPKEPK
jgi:hypothetical protein